MNVNACIRLKSRLLLHVYVANSLAWPGAQCSSKIVVVVRAGGFPSLQAAVIASAPGRLGLGLGSAALEVEVVETKELVILGLAVALCLKSISRSDVKSTPSLEINIVSASVLLHWAPKIYDHACLGERYRKTSEITVGYGEFLIKLTFVNILHTQMVILATRTRGLSCRIRFFFLLYLDLKRVDIDKMMIGKNIDLILL